MRVFAALPLPAAVAAGIGSAFSSARTLAPKARWVSPEGMHLTLHFFGEIPEEKISGFSPLFDDPELRTPAIRTRLGEPGFFPPSGRPRVLWIGLQEGAEEMRAFWKLFTEKLQPLRRSDGPLCEWSPDGRGFTPHVTVARSGSTPFSAHWAQAVKIPSGEFLITECVLFQSLLGAGGAQYLPLRTIPFERGCA
ncbi:MAG: RNA 2',3'-cyclic phosphodiesterase [Spirochaetia bacterium]